MSETAETWTRERIDLIKRTVVPQGIPDAEFALFIEQCRRSGLDPLLKQAFCVKRKQNIGSRERPQWVDKYEFQPAETGLLARAEGMPDFAGISASAVCAHDDVLIDAGGGEVHHSYSPVGQRGPLLGAWARVERRGRLPVIVWLDVGAYSQQTATWSRMPATMIEKCARVAALRKAYPSAFGGLYIREEMPEEDAAYVLEREMAPPPPLAAQLPAAAVGGAIGVPVQSRIPARLASVAAPPTPAPAPKSRRAAKAPPALPSAVTAPWTRIKALATQHGIADTALFQALREATGKVSPGKMTAEDVARFEAHVSARGGGGANVQAETDAPDDTAPSVERPPGEEEDPAGEIPF